MIHWTTSKLHFWLKMTALMVTLIFTWNTIVGADGVRNILQELQSLEQQKTEQQKAGILRVFSAKLPEDLGQIKRSYQGNRSELIIHIQDAHINEEAQRRIADIIDYYVKEHSVHLVSVEGAAGELAHRLLSAYPNAKARELMADHFLKEGMISGPEYLALSKCPELILNGVEDKLLYDENRKAFIEALQFKEEDTVVLARIRKVLEGVARHLFSETLGELVRRQHSFQNEEIELASYLSYLEELAKINNVKEPRPQIEAFLKLLRLEGDLNIEEAEKEVSEVIEALRQNLKGDESNEFIKKSSGFESKTVSRGAYYKYLSSLFVQLPAGSSYPHFQNYVEYIALYDSIGSELFGEIKRVENALQEKLIRNVQEKELAHLFELLGIYEKIFNFSLSKDAAEFFYHFHSEFKSDTFVDFLTPLMKQFHFGSHLDGIGMKKLDRDLPKIEHFYETALRRDSILIERTLSSMEKKHHVVSILVTGGFHTPGIERILREKDYSYLVIAPRLTQAIDENKESKRYAQAMKLEPTKLAKILAEAYFPAHSGLAKDPRYQLGTPTRFPTLEAVDKISVTESEFDPRSFIKDHPEMDFEITAAQILQASHAWLKKEILPLDYLMASMSLLLGDAELKLMRSLYGLFDQDELLDLGAYGMLVSRPLKDGSFLAASWAPSEPMSEISVQRKTQAKFKMGEGELVLRVVKDKTELSLLKRQFASRAQARSKKMALKQKTIQRNVVIENNVPQKKAESPPQSQTKIMESESEMEKKSAGRSEVRSFGRRQFLKMIAAGMASMSSNILEVRQRANAAQPVSPVPRAGDQDRIATQAMIDIVNEALARHPRIAPGGKLPADHRIVLDPSLREELLASQGRRLPRDTFTHHTRTSRPDLVFQVEKIFRDPRSFGRTLQGPEEFNAHDILEEFLLPLFKLLGITSRSREEASFLRHFSGQARLLKERLLTAKIQKDSEIPRLYVTDFINIIGARDQDGNPLAPTDIWVQLNKTWQPEVRIPNIDYATFVGMTLFFTMIRVAEDLEVQNHTNPYRRPYWQFENLFRFFIKSLNKEETLRINLREVQEFLTVFGGLKFDIFFAAAPLDVRRFLRDEAGLWFAEILTGEGKNSAEREILSRRVPYPHLRNSDEIVDARSLAAAAFLPVIVNLSRTPMWPHRDITEQRSRTDFTRMLRSYAQVMREIQSTVRQLHDRYDPPLVENTFFEWRRGSFRRTARSLPHITPGQILNMDFNQLPADAIFLQTKAELERNQAQSRELRILMVELASGLDMGRLNYWSLYGLRRGLVRVDAKGEVNANELIAMLVDMRSLLPVLEHLFYGGKQFLNLNDDRSMGILAGMIRTIRHSRISIQNFKALLAMAVDPGLQREALRVHHAVTLNPTYQRRLDLSEPNHMGGLVGWAASRYLEGMHRSRSKAVRVIEVFNDSSRYPDSFGNTYFKREKFYEFANRLRRIWNPNARTFTQEQLRTAPPASDDIIGYLIAEASASSEIPWNEWVDLRQKTIELLRRRDAKSFDSSRDVILDAFYVLQALRGQPVEGKVFRQAFEAFNRDLANRPQDQGWVISWAQNLVERRIPEGRPWGRMVADSIVKNNLAKFVERSDALRQAFGQAMGVRYPRIDYARRFELDTDSQGWLLSFLQSVASREHVYLRRVEEMILYFRWLAGEGARVDQALASAEKTYDLLRREQRNFPPLTRISVTQNRRAQEVFFSWAEEYGRIQRSEVRSRSISDIRTPQALLSDLEKTLHIEWSGMQNQRLKIAEHRANLWEYLNHGTVHNEDVIAHYRLNHAPPGIRSGKRWDDKSWVPSALAILDHEWLYLQNLKATLEKMPDTLKHLLHLFKKRPGEKGSADDLRRDLTQKFQLVGELINQVKKINSDLDLQFLQMFRALLGKERKNLKQIIGKALVMKEKKPHKTAAAEKETRGPPEKKSAGSYFKIAAAVLIVGFISLFGLLVPSPSQEIKQVIQKQEIPDLMKDDKEFEDEARRLVRMNFKKPLPIPPSELDQDLYRKLVNQHDLDLKVEASDGLNAFRKLPYGEKGNQRIFERVRIRGQELSKDVPASFVKKGVSKDGGIAGIEWISRVEGSTRFPVRLYIMSDGFYVGPNVTPKHIRGGTFRPVLQGTTMGEEKSGEFPWVRWLDIDSVKGQSNTIRVRALVDHRKFSGVVNMQIRTRDEDGEMEIRTRTKLFVRENTQDLGFGWSTSFIREPGVDMKGYGDNDTIVGKYDVKGQNIIRYIRMENPPQKKVVNLSPEMGAAAKGFDVLTTLFAEQSQAGRQYTPNFRTQILKSTHPLEMLYYSFPADYPKEQVIFDPEAIKEFPDNGVIMARIAGVLQKGEQVVYETVSQIDTNKELALGVTRYDDSQRVLKLLMDAWSDRLIPGRETRKEVIEDAFILRRALKGQPFNLKEPDVAEAHERFASEFAKNPNDEALIVHWTKNRVRRGFVATTGLAEKMGEILRVKALLESMLQFSKQLPRHGGGLEESITEGDLNGLAEAIAVTRKSDPTITDEMIIARLNEMTKATPAFLHGFDKEGNPLPAGDLAKSRAAKLYRQIMGFSLDLEDPDGMGWLISNIGYVGGLTGWEKARRDEREEWFKRSIEERVKMIHARLERAVGMIAVGPDQRSLMERLYNAIVLPEEGKKMPPAFNVTNPVHYGLLMAWADQGPERAERFISLVQSQTFQNYMAELNEDENYNFKKELSDSFKKADVHDAARGKFLDLVGRVTFYLNQYQSAELLNTELQKRIDLIKKIQNQEKGSARSAIQDLFQTFTFNRLVDIGKYKAANVYELHRAMSLSMREARYQNEGRRWDNAAQDYEARNFDVFFLEMQVSITRQVMDRDPISLTELTRYRRDLFKALANYPVENEFGVSHERRFQDFLLGLQEEGLRVPQQISEEHLRNFFKFNDILVAQSQWYERMRTKTEFDPDGPLHLTQVIKKIEDRKEAWIQYNKYWKPIGLTLTTPQLSFLAEKGVDQEFFKMGKFEFAITRKYLGRNIPMDMLFTYITTYSYDRDFYWRNGFPNFLADVYGRPDLKDFVPRWRMTNRFARMDQTNQELLKQLLDHGTLDEIGMLNVDGAPTLNELDPNSWHEKLRFALWYFGKSMQFIPHDYQFKRNYDANEFRARLLAFLGKGTSEDRRHYMELLEATEKVPADLNAAIFGGPYFVSPEELKNDRSLSEYIIRTLVGRPDRRSLTRERLKMSGQEFVHDLAVYFEADNIDEEHFVRLLAGKKVSREELVAAFNDFATIVYRIRKDYGITLQKNKLLETTVEERLNGNVKYIRKMRMDMLNYFMTKLHGAEPVPLDRLEVMNLPQDQLQLWIKQHHLEKLIPKAIQEKLAEGMVRELIDRRSTKRLLIDFRNAVNIFTHQENRVAWLNKRNEVTPDVAESLLRLIDNVYQMGLQNNGIISKPTELIPREKEYKKALDGHLEFDGRRQAEDEIFDRLNLFNSNIEQAVGHQKDIVEVTTEREKSNQRINVQKLMEFAGHILGIYTLWHAMLVVWATLVARFQRHSAETQTASEADVARIKQEKGQDHPIKVGDRVVGGGREKVERIIVKEYPQPTTLKMWLYFVPMLLQLATYLGFYLLILDFANINVPVILVVALLGTSLTVGSAMTVMDRLTTMASWKMFVYMIPIIAQAAIYPMILVTLWSHLPAVAAITLTWATVVLAWYALNGTMILLNGKYRNDATLHPRTVKKGRIALYVASMILQSYIFPKLIGFILVSSAWVAPVFAVFVGMVGATMFAGSIHGLLKGTPQFFETPTKNQREPERDRVSFDGNKLPPNRKTGVKMVTMLSDEKGAKEVLDRLIHSVRSQNDPNIFGLLYDGGANTPALRQKIKEWMDKAREDYGIRIYYFHRNEPSLSENIEKKYGSHQEIYRFLYDGVTQPVTDSERYMHRNLPLNQFIFSAPIAWPLYVVFSVLGISNPVLWGVLVALGIGFAWSMAISGATKNKQVDRERNHFFDEVYGDLTFLGFTEADFNTLIQNYPNPHDRFRTPLVRNADAQGGKTYEMADHFDRTWALFLLDDKNFAGYTSVNDATEKSVESGLNYRSGRESGIREAIRQALGDERHIINREDQNEFIRNAVNQMKAAGMNLDTTSLSDFQTYFNHVFGFTIDVNQFLEQYGHFEPVRKSVEVMSHEKNRWAAYGNVYIEITGEISQWSEINVKFARGGAAFDESKKRNLPADNEYGKSLVVLARWMQGTEPKMQPGLKGWLFHPRPYWFFAATVGGSVLGAVIGSVITHLLGVGLPMIYSAAGYGAFLGFMILGVVAGQFEGRFYKGVFGTLQVRDLTHDSREASFGGAVHVIRASVFEPSTGSMGEHIPRALLRWDPGEKRTWWYALGPGMFLASRWHHYMAVRMYITEPKFFIWLGLTLLTSVTLSGFIDTFSFMSRALEFAEPGWAWVLLGYVMWGIVIMPNFITGTGLPFGKKFAGFGERIEQNRISGPDRIANVQIGTLIYMNIPFIGALTNMMNKWRVMIVGPHPREDTKKISKARQWAGLVVGLLTIPVIILLPGFFSSLGIPAMILGIPTVAFPITAATLLSMFLFTPAPLLMAMLVFLGPMYLAPFSLPYLAIATILGLLFSHRMSGRYITLPWLLTGLLNTGLIALAPVVPFVIASGLENPLIFLGQFGISPIMVLAILSIAVLTYIQKVAFKTIFNTKSGYLRDTLPWSTYSAEKGAQISITMFDATKRFGASFIFGTGIWLASAIVWSNAWTTIVLFPLLFSWFRGATRSWIMDQKGEGKKVADQYHNQWVRRPLPPQVKMAAGAITGLGLGYFSAAVAGLGIGLIFLNSMAGVIAGYFISRMLPDHTWRIKFPNYGIKRTDRVGTVLKTVLGIFSMGLTAIGLSPGLVLTIFNMLKVDLKNLKAKVKETYDPHAKLDAYDRWINRMKYTASLVTNAFYGYGYLLGMVLSFFMTIAIVQQFFQFAPIATTGIRFQLTVGSIILAMAIPMMLGYALAIMPLYTGWALFNASSYLLGLPYAGHPFGSWNLTSILVFGILTSPAVWLWVAGRIAELKETLFQLKADTKSQWNKLSGHQKMGMILTALSFLLSGLSAFIVSTVIGVALVKDERRIDYPLPQIPGAEQMEDLESLISPPRSEVRQVAQATKQSDHEGLLEALKSAEEIERVNRTEQEKQTYFEMVRDADESRIASALHRAIEKMGVTTQGTATLPGELVVNYRGVKDDAALSGIFGDLKLHTEVKVFIFNSSFLHDGDNVMERFGDQITQAGSRVELVDRTKFTTVAQFVLARARERRMRDEREIIQIMMNEILHSPKEINLILNAWAAALIEAEGKATIVVIGARERIGKARVITLIDILRESFEAMQAVTYSA